MNFLHDTSISLSKRLTETCIIEIFISALTRLLEHLSFIINYIINIFFLHLLIPQQEFYLRAVTALENCKASTRSPRLALKIKIRNSFVPKAPKPNGPFKASIERATKFTGNVNDESRFPHNLDWQHTLTSQHLSKSKTNRRSSAVRFLPKLSAAFASTSLITGAARRRSTSTHALSDAQVKREGGEPLHL